MDRQVRPLACTAAAGVNLPWSTHSLTHVCLAVAPSSFVAGAPAVAYARTFWPQGKSSDERETDPELLIGSVTDADRQGHAQQLSDAYNGSQLKQVRHFNTVLETGAELLTAHLCARGSRRCCDSSEVQ